MVSQAQAILQQMGLSEGYHIPIANAENVKLEAELQRLILVKAKVTSTLESVNTKRAGLNKHMKYVRSEQIENQNLLFARNTQIENENHLYSILKREREQEIQEVRKMINAEKKIEGTRKNKCESLKFLISKMEKIKLSVKWDEQTIESLEEIVLKKDDDNEVIKKFSKEDRRKAEELEVKRKRLREEELARRQLASRVANEIENLQLTIGRNVQMYKQMCEERNMMVRQWQDSVKQLQQRNKDTIALVGEIASVKDLVSIHIDTFKEQHLFVENQRTNNLEMDIKIDIENTNVAKTKNKLNRCQQRIKDQTIEFTAILRELRTAASSLEQQRVEKRQVESALKADKASLETANFKVERLREQLKIVQDTKLSAEERSRQLEEMLQTEEKNSELLVNDIERIQGVLFRSESVLADLLEAFKQKELKQRVNENTLVLLERQKAQIELETRQSAEQLYKFHFRINMIENRLARVTGEQNDEVNQVHQIRLRELQATFTYVNETTHLLQTQITKLEEDMRRMSISTITDAELLQTKRSRLDDRMLMVEGAVKLVAKKRVRNNMLKVEQNVLAVRVKGAENLKLKEGGIIYSLQCQKSELDAAIRERQTEITVEKELLFTKRRSLQDDNGRMRGDIQLRKIKIEQLKTRIDCILESLGRSDDGEALSVTYFRVRNAQEKYSLQQEGDRLDSLIKKSEKEIIALENTLRVVNNTNNTYKKSLDMLEENGDELAELKRLEEIYKEVGIESRSRTNVLSDRSQKIREMRACVEETRLKHSEILVEVSKVKCKLDEICAEENKRKTQLNRAIVTSTKECSCGDGFKDMTTRQFKEVNNSALQQLLEMSIRFIETEPVINKYLTNGGLPALSSSLKSSQSSSSRSQSSVKQTRSKSSTSSNSTHSSSSVLTSVLFTLDFPKC